VVTESHGSLGRRDSRVAWEKSTRQSGFLFLLNSTKQEEFMKKLWLTAVMGLFTLGLLAQGPAPGR
jgi:hypothetical protein